MTQTNDGSAPRGNGFSSSHDDPIETNGPEAARARAHGAEPAAAPRPRGESPAFSGAPLAAGEGAPAADGLVEREAAAAVASLEALRRVAHFGRARPDLAERLSVALAQVDEALAEAVRELYGKADESDAD